MVFEFNRADSLAACDELSRVEWPNKSLNPGIKLMGITIPPTPDIYHVNFFPLK
jgi:hypothetical protein